CRAVDGPDQVMAAPSAELEATTSNVATSAANAARNRACISPLPWSIFPRRQSTPGHSLEQLWVRSRRTSTAILLRLFRIWLRVNLALLLAFGIALMVGTPLVTTLGAAVAVWALAGSHSGGCGAVAGQLPGERAAHTSPRRKCADVDRSTTGR